MADEVVARRYAAALVAAADGPEDLERMLHELVVVRDSLRHVEGLKELLMNLGVKAQEKERFVKQVFKGRVDDRIYRFLIAIFSRRRVAVLDGIVHATRDAVDSLFGRHRAWVVSAIELPGEMRERIHTTLERTTGYTLEVGFKENSDMLGGLYVQIDDKVLDARFSRALTALHEELLNDRLLLRAHGAPTEV